MILKRETFHLWIGFACSGNAKNDDLLFPNLLPSMLSCLKGDSENQTVSRTQYCVVVGSKIVRLFFLLSPTPPSPDWVLFLLSVEFIMSILRQIMKNLLTERKGIANKASQQLEIMLSDNQTSSFVVFVNFSYNLNSPYVCALSLSFQSIVQSLCDPTVSLIPFQTPFTDQHVSHFSKGLFSPMHLL